MLSGMSTGGGSSWIGRLCESYGNVLNNFAYGAPGCQPNIQSPKQLCPALLPASSGNKLKELIAA